MDFITNADGTLISIGDKVRIESGPVRKREVATEVLLSNDVTAGHYHAPVKDEQGNVIKEAIDALGKPIELGKDFDYIDWLAPERAWYVYRLDKIVSVVMKQGPKKGETVEKPHYVLDSTHVSRDAAITRGLAIAAA